MFRIIVLTIIASLLPSRASAYIDPGAGSYLFQLIIGVVLGAVFTIKMYWRQLSGFLRKLFLNKRKHGNDVS